MIGYIIFCKQENSRFIEVVIIKQVSEHSVLKILNIMSYPILKICHIKYSLYFCLHFVKCLYHDVSTHTI